MSLEVEQDSSVLATVAAAEAAADILHLLQHTTQYDTIRAAILTYDQKLT